MCHNKNVLCNSNLPVSVSKFGIDTTKNRWYRIGIVSVSYRFEKAGIAHPYYKNNRLEVEGQFCFKGGDQVIVRV